MEDFTNISLTTEIITSIEELLIYMKKKKTFILGTKGSIAHITINQIKKLSMKEVLNLIKNERLEVIIEEK